MQDLNKWLLYCYANYFPRYRCRPSCVVWIPFWELQLRSSCLYSKLFCESIPQTLTFFTFSLKIDSPWVIHQILALINPDIGLEYRNVLPILILFRSIFFLLEVNLVGTKNGLGRRLNINKVYIIRRQGVSPQKVKFSIMRTK